MNPRPPQTADVHTQRRQPGRRGRLTVAAQRSATVVAGALAVTSGWTHRHQLGAGFGLLDHLSWWWLVAGFVFEGASLAPVGLLQRRLLRDGDVNISAVDVTKISVAANAISFSLPAGGAWSATWSWKALRRHGADRALAAWVVAVAGAVSAFALLVLFVAGAELAGNHGPVASLRWPARALAGVAAGGFLLVVATRARRSRRSHPGRVLGRLFDRTRVVRPSPRAWAAALSLALANWLLDLACMVACIVAVGADIDWRGVVVVYAVAQMIAALPLTPGGLGVVEAGLAGLLVRYGTAMPSAIATVVVYRALTFWPLVPAGWIVWWRLDKARPAVGPLGRPRGQKPLITSTAITHENGSSVREYQFRQRLLPDMEFKAVPLMVPAPGTPNQTPTRVFDE